MPNAAQLIGIGAASVTVWGRKRDNLQIRPSPLTSESLDIHNVNRKVAEIENESIPKPCLSSPAFFTRSSRINRLLRKSVELGMTQFSAVVSARTSGSSSPIGVAVKEQSTEDQRV